MIGLVLIIIGCITFFVYRGERGLAKKIGGFLLVAGILILVFSFVYAYFETNSIMAFLRQYQVGRYEEAIETLEKVKYSRDSRVYLFLSKAYEQIGDNQKADYNYHIAYTLFKADSELQKKYSNLDVMWQDWMEIISR